MADSNFGNEVWRRASAGTYQDKAIPRAALIAFTVATFVLVLVPSVGMFWARTDATSENRELAALPGVVEEDGAFNWDILADLGDYFDDHYAYRNEAVTVNAHMRAALCTSATDQVVVGDDGWLYYGGTLPDYLGQNQLSDRSLANIAHNLSLAQHYVEHQGATFAFTLAPNKNSLDRSHMPYYYLPYGGASNAERLVAYLQDADVNYVDLFSFFGNKMDQGEPIGYLKLDSHWNNRWALLATEQLLAGVGRDKLDVDPEAGVVRPDFSGDLQSMLYPASPLLEENYYYDGYNDAQGSSELAWRYVEGEDVTDSSIRTSSSSALQGSLLMFRDSFGNAMLPYLASAYENASFSKLIPYNLAQISQLKPDAVVVERAERHLDYLATDPPIMSNPTLPVDSSALEESVEVKADVEVETSGSYWVVRGEVLDELPSPTSRIYVVVEKQGDPSVAFDPFWTSFASDSGEVIGDQGFMLYAPASALDIADATVKVYAS